jgi:anti-anti-sigma regulatory factor
MFTSQSLRAVVKPGGVSVREHRLDDVVHQIEVRGDLTSDNAPELARRLDAALSGGVRWLILDFAEALNVSDSVISHLSAAVRELRSRRGELIVAAPSPSVNERVNALEVAFRPAVAANVDQAIMILKMLRPKTDISHPVQRAKQKISSLSLPRIEPPGRPA